MRYMLIFNSTMPPVLMREVGMFRILDPLMGLCKSALCRVSYSRSFRRPRRRIPDEPTQALRRQVTRHNQIARQPSRLRTSSNQSRIAI